MVMKKCPVCGVSVKVENLERHVKNQHPRAAVDLRTALTDDERREVDEAKRSSAPVVTSRGIRLIAIVAVVIAVLLVLVIFNPFRSVGPGVGQIAPDFTLQRSDGGTFSLSSTRGSVVLLEFMDVDCSYCQREASVLLGVFLNYSSRGVRFLSVDANIIGQDDTLTRIEEFKAQHGTNWVYVLDSGRSTDNAYGVGSTPMTFILDRGGVIKQIFTGAAPGGASDYTKALDAALGG